MQGKAKMNRYITIEKFIDILNEDEFTPGASCYGAGCSCGYLSAYRQVPD